MEFKNIRIKMKGGKSRMQRVKVLASGKYKFVKNIRGTKSHPKKSESSNPRPKKARKVRRNLARRKRIRKRITSMTIPLAPVLGLAVGIVTRRPDWGESPVELIMRGDWNMAFESLKQSYLGIHPNGGWDPNLMAHGTLPLIIGALVHKFVGGAPLNINKMLAAAKVPLIRI